MLLLLGAKESIAFRHTKINKTEKSNNNNNKNENYIDISKIVNDKNLNKTKLGNRKIKTNLKC